MPSLTWLHFSDLHQLESSDWHAGPLLGRLLDDFRQMKDGGVSPDLIFFTGDAAFGHLGDAPAANIANQFDKAEELFAKVRDIFAVKQRAFYLVPGNHDVNRADAVPGLYHWLDAMKAKGTGGDLTDSVNKKDANWKTFMLRLQSYRAFLERYDYAHCLTDPDRLMFWDSVKSGNYRVGIAGLNTAWSCGRDGEARGDPWFASDYQIGTLSNKTRENDYSIALMHHPLDWGNEIETPLERKLLRTSFLFSLHGHEHDQAIQAESSHVRIAAGAASERTREHCGYNFVSFDPATGQGTVRARSYYPDANRFDWSVLPEQGNGPGTKAFALPRVSRQGTGAASGKRVSAIKARAKTAKAEDRQDGNGWTPREGVVAVLDFCAFTNFPPQAQMDGLGSLHQNLRALVPAGAFWNATASGAIISWQADLELAASQIFLFLENLRIALERNGVEMQLRAAIHTGVHFTIPGERITSPSMFGTTVNDALGLARVGGAGDIVVSHTFFDNYVRNDEEAMASRFLPPSGENALEFERGNQRYLAARLLVRTKEARTPRALRVLSAISDRIETELAGLEFLLREYLREEAGLTITPRKLRARVSIWEKRLKDGSEILYPTRFRFINPSEPASVKPGKTRYSLRGEGQGVPGMALVRHKALAINRLPNWSKDPDGYCKALAEFNLSREMIPALGRKAGSFLCFPLTIFETADGETADACICIDCADPLRTVDPETLTQIADMLREDADEILALLWLLRVST